MQGWTEQDFDELCWHDCHVHAWGIAEAEAARGTATLTLDIDFITTWEQPGDGTLALQVAPATLVFFDVFEFAFSVQDTAMLDLVVPRIRAVGIERCGSCRLLRATSETHGVVELVVEPTIEIRCGGSISA